MCVVQELEKREAELSQRQQGLELRERKVEQMEAAAQVRLVRA